MVIRVTCIEISLCLGGSGGGRRRRRVTAGARLAEALRKSRDVNEPEVSSDMRVVRSGYAILWCLLPRDCAHGGLRKVGSKHV